jgi:hypothetical protein
MIEDESDCEDESEWAGGEPPSYKQLANELGSAYGLLLQTLPMAMSALKSGTVSLSDQRSFWMEVGFVERFCPVFEVDSDTRELVLEEGELVHRRDAMERLSVAVSKTSSETP